MICDAFSPRVLIQKLFIAPFTPYVGLYEFVNGFEVHRTYFSFGRMMELLDLSSINKPFRPTVNITDASLTRISSVDVCRSWRRVGVSYLSELA